MLLTTCPQVFRSTGAHTAVARSLLREEAETLEKALGIHVLRHADKKPAGSSAELEAHFGCPASELIMVGDRCARVHVATGGMAPPGCSAAQFNTRAALPSRVPSCH